MPTPFQPDDILLERRITEIHAARRGRVAACAVSWPEPKADAYRSALWLLPLDGRPGRQLTAGTALDSVPRWSPSGNEIAFLSDREGGDPQIHLIRPDGGEARRLGRFKKGVVSIAWRPQGGRLLATCPLPVDPGQRGGPGRFDTEPQSGAPRVVWRLPYKLDAGGYTLDQEVHLFTIDATSAESRQLTHGAFDVRSAAWSPDGERIVFTRTREDRRMAHRTDVWVCDADGANARQLSSEQGSAIGPSWSPDGRWIAFSGALDEGDAQMRLWLIDVASGAVRPLGDESIEVVADTDLQWSRDSSAVSFINAHRGLQHVTTVTLDGTLRRITEGARHVSHLACTEERLVYSAERPDAPMEVYACDPDGAHETPLHRFNTWRDERTEPQVALRMFDVPDGRGGRERVEGWLLTPQQPGPRVPLLVDVHGGPASYAFVSFHKLAYWQVLCARGWAVLALNPVGSSSYGREFSERLRGHWGEYDLPQHIAAVQALKEEGIGSGGVAITGSSYGGYLSAWAVGQDALFDAAVVIAPVGNLESHFGTSDSGFYADPYSMCGEPHINRDASVRLSPMKHIEKARTPTLFLQGEEDQRCPRGQSEELFVTLMRAGDTPTELVLYPGGSHHFLSQGKPSHRLDALQRLLEWLERWIGRRTGAQGGATPAR